MKYFITSLCATALLAGLPLVGSAQDKSTSSKSSQEVQQQTKTYNSNGSEKVNKDTVTGKVENFEPGKSLKVTVPGKLVSTKSWSLDNKDWTYHVARNLKAGQWVTVSERTDNNGHKTLTVAHSSKRSQGTASRSYR